MSACTWMLDGEGNTVTEHEFRAAAVGNGQSVRQRVRHHVARSHRASVDAIAEADGRTGRYWKITNPNEKNSVGGPTAYKLLVQQYAR